MIQATPSTKLKKREKELLVLELVALTTAQRVDFMAAQGLPISLSNKGEVRDRIETSLDDGDFDYTDLIGYLDEVVPSGKQHVYLFNGPSGSTKNTWQKQPWVKRHLKKHAPDVFALLSGGKHVGLPEELTPTSIEWTADRITLQLVRRREWFERDKQYDDQKETPAGEPVELRAFVHRVIRNLIVFEWDLKTNTAALRISQLAGGVRYENVKQEVAALLAPWLNLGTFALLDLHPAILNLMKLERSGKGITRSHDFEVLTSTGRAVSVRSNANDAPAVGDKATKAVFDSIPGTVTGNTGNFYWLPERGNPLSEELRVVLVGDKDRINFTAPSNEKIIQRVLSDIRKHC
ncbi:hypothetical protein [Roseiconus lacunae]|uniref:hypothetical protein n=1 Tax=Roseiconus lacunae TaxID=2605694 RepID=UPI001E2E4139|nr:hypothetical protein [Roseiconus lacunae]MCD0460694.1 hypothetical protein [Roseiconus lacunae]